MWKKLLFKYKLILIKRNVLIVAVSTRKNGGSLERKGIWKRLNKNNKLKVKNQNLKKRMFTKTKVIKDRIKINKAIEITIIKDSIDKIIITKIGMEVARAIINMIKNTEIIEDKKETTKVSLIREALMDMTIDIEEKEKDAIKVSQIKEAIMHMIIDRQYLKSETLSTFIVNTA